MGRAFLDRFEAIREGGGLDPHAVFSALERHQSLKPVVNDLGLEPPEMLAVLAFGALGDGQHEIGPELVRKRPVLGDASAFSESSLAVLYPEASRPERLALSAGLLQVLDHWDASHTAAQEADDLGETNVSAYWHGIAHRREPDPGNAAYWFRRIGRHPVFAPLADAARPLLTDEADLAARLLPRGDWDPFAFIDLCTRARGEQAAIARRLQRLEMLLLLDASIPAAFS